MVHLGRGRLICKSEARQGVCEVLTSGSVLSHSTRTITVLTQEEQTSAGSAYCSRVT